MPEQTGTMDTATWAALTHQLEDQAHGAPVSDERRAAARRWARSAIARVNTDRRTPEHQAARARALGDAA
ncbi:hypothetical protein [Catellatospora sp. NPDC049609]|uniref:hypothetical protein n=1 Tax=Catellatospora sp. NPDC049609 TaxID=3155505 RepID=UPI003431E6E2